MRLERERAGYRNAHSGLGSAGARSLLCSRLEPRLCHVTKGRATDPTRMWGSE